MLGGTIRHRNNPIEHCTDQNLISGPGYDVVRLVLSNPLMKLSLKFMDLHSKMKSRTDIPLKR